MKRMSEFTPVNFCISCKNNKLGWEVSQIMIGREGAVSSVNLENSHKESLLSAVEDFSPQPSPNPADFSDSKKGIKGKKESR